MTLAVLALGGALTLASCGGSSSNSAGPYSASGTWNGTSTNNNNNNSIATQQLVLSDNNASITGVDYIITSDGTKGVFGTLSGTRNADNSANINLTVTLTGLPGTATYSGKFVGNSFTGSYSASGGGAGPFSFTRN